MQHFQNLAIIILSGWETIFMQHFQNLAIIVLLNFLVYYKTLFFGYVGDDIERAERAQEFKNIFHRWWLQFIGLKHRNPMVAHFISIITHTACAMMIYLSLGSFFGDYPSAFLAALLFSINPINMQGSVWISGRNYAVSAIFALSMFLFPLISWMPYIATSHFAVNAWFAPLLFLGTKYWYMAGIIPITWLLTTNNRQTLHRKLWETGDLKTTNSEMRAIKIQKIIPFLKTYIYYFGLCVFPFRLGIEHDFLRGFGTNKTDNAKGYKMDWIFFTGLAVFGSVCLLSVHSILTSYHSILISHNWNPIIWGLFWFTINIAMWCNFVTYQQQLAERYCYLANIGMMFAIANLIINYPVLIAVFLIAYLIRLWYSMEIYLDDYWAVEHTLIEQKGMYYLWLMRGVKKFMIKDHIGALYDFNMAYRFKPYDLKILFNLATTTFLLGDADKAREYLTKARENVYDELDTTKPAFDNLEAMIKTVEETKARGETRVQIDMNKVMIVK